MRALIVILVALAASPSSSAFAAKKKVDPLALARVLLRDGLPNRAVAALAEIDLVKDEVDLAEFYRLRGLAEHELGRFAEAVSSFQLSMQHGDTSTLTWYALANAQFAAGQAKVSLATLERAPKEIWELAGAHRVKASAYYKTGDRHRAFDAADAGFARFRGDAELEGLRVRLFLELGLSRDGLEAAYRYFERPTISAKDYLTAASALASAKDLAHSAELLEAGMLRFPDDREVRKQLARTYFEAKRPLAAAHVLHPVALEEPASALLVADLYRRAGKLEDALRMNGLVNDQKEKMRQRLNLLIELERFHEAAGLDERLSRLGLLSEQKLLYALAYAHYLTGNKVRVEQLLSRVTEPELFAKATAIRRAIEVCEQDIWQCD